MSDDFLYGSIIGGFFFLFLYIWVLCLLSSQKLLTKKLLIVLLLAFIAHILALNVYASTPSDSSVTFFPLAIDRWSGIGGAFVLYFSGMLKKIGFDTLISQFYFSNALGFLGSYFYFRTYIQLVKTTSIQPKEYSCYLVYFLIWLWPSFLFWTTGIGKDSTMFLAFAMFFYALSLFDTNVFKAIIFACIGLGLVWLIRPQIYLVLMGAAVMLSFFSKRISLTMRVFLLLAFVVFLIYLLPVIFAYGKIEGVSDIALRGVQQQNYQSNGTAIAVVTQDSRLMLFFLPYMMIANLFFPLFFLARNLIGYAASIENVFFIYLVFLYLKLRSRLFSFFPANNFFKYVELYLLCGVGLLGISNTNLGLAMRQKIMYTGPFMVLICVAIAVMKELKARQRYLRRRNKS